MYGEVTMHKMHFYITRTPDGLYHVQNFVNGYRGQHHVHTPSEFKQWRKGIDRKYVHWIAAKYCCDIRPGEWGIWED